MLRFQKRLSVGVAQAALVLLAATAVRAADPASTGAADDAASVGSRAGRSVEVEGITVTANAKKSQVTRVVQTGILGSQSVLKTPFTVSAVTSREIEDLQTKDIAGAFRDDSSITEINSSVAQASGSSVRIRGVALEQFNSFKIDGLTIPYWSIDLPIEQFDQIQLFKGATGFLYGFGSPGGIINFVSRRPTDEPTYSADLGYRSDNLFSGHVDAGGRAANDLIGYRVNLQGEAGKVYTGGYNANYSGAIALDARLTDKLTWTGDVFYMHTDQEDEVNTVSVTSAVTHLAPVSGDTNFAARGDRKTNEMGVFTTGFKYAINSNWTASLLYRYDRLNENFPGGNLSITDNRGDYTANYFFVQRLFGFDELQALVQGHFDTGPLTHDLVFGAEDENQRFWLDNQSLVTAAHSIIGTGNIYNNYEQPTLSSHPTSLYNPKLFLNNIYRQGSLFAGDTIGWGKWSLLAGVRYTSYRNTAFTIGPSTTSTPPPLSSAIKTQFTAEPVSPTFALSYELLPQTRAYVSYIEGLQNGTLAPTTAVNFGSSAGPIHTKQYEAGLKTDQGVWNGTLAVFRTDEGGAGYLNTSNFFVQGGLQRYQGVEVNAAVRPAPEWSVAASATYIDSSESQVPAAQGNGKQIPGVPSWQAALRIGYLPPIVPGLGLDVNIRYNGKGYDNTVNTFALPAYVTADLLASYAVTLDHRHVTFRAGVKNVTDHEYWVYSSSTVIPGEPRTYVLGAHVDF